MTEEDRLKNVLELLRDMGFILEDWHCADLWQHAPSWAITIAETILDRGWRRL